MSTARPLLEAINTSLSVLSSTFATDTEETTTWLPPSTTTSTTSTTSAIFLDDVSYEDYNDYYSSPEGNEVTVPDHDTWQPNFTGIHSLAAESLEETEPEVWDARSAFIEMVAGKVYMVFPAFAVGLILGIIMWALYIFVFKSSTRLHKKRGDNYLSNIVQTQAGDAEEGEEEGGGGGETDDEDVEDQPPKPVETRRIDQFAFNHRDMINRMTRGVNLPASASQVSRMTVSTSSGSVTPSTADNTSIDSIHIVSSTDQSDQDGSGRPGRRTDGSQVNELLNDQGGIHIAMVHSSMETVDSSTMESSRL